MALKGNRVRFQEPHRARLSRAATPAPLISSTFSQCTRPKAKATSGRPNSTHTAKPFLTECDRQCCAGRKPREQHLLPPFSSRRQLTHHMPRCLGHSFKPCGARILAEPPCCPACCCCSTLHEPCCSWKWCVCDMCSMCSCTCTCCKVLVKDWHCAGSSSVCECGSRGCPSAQAGTGDGCSCGFCVSYCCRGHHGGARGGMQASVLLRCCCLGGGWLICAAVGQLNCRGW